MKSLNDNLIAARDLLLSSGLARGALARGADSRPVPPTSPHATCFCAVGAAKRVVPNDRAMVKSMCRVLHSALKDAWQSVEGFNDGADTRKRDVIALYNRAIKLTA